MEKGQGHAKPGLSAGLVAPCLAMLPLYLSASLSLCWTQAPCLSSLPLCLPASLLDPWLTACHCCLSASLLDSWLTACHCCLSASLLDSWLTACHCCPSASLPRCLSAGLVAHRLSSLLNSWLPAWHPCLVSICSSRGHKQTENSRLPHLVLSLRLGGLERAREDGNLHVFELFWHLQKQAAGSAQCSMLSNPCGR